MCCQFDVPSNTSLSTYICVMFVSFKITYIHTYIHTYLSVFYKLLRQVMSRRLLEQLVKSCTYIPSIFSSSMASSLSSRKPIFHESASLPESIFKNPWCQIPGASSLSIRSPLWHCYPNEFPKGCALPIDAITFLRCHWRTFHHTHKAIVRRLREIRQRETVHSNHCVDSAFFLQILDFDCAFTVAIVVSHTLLANVVDFNDLAPHWKKLVCAAHERWPWKVEPVIGKFPCGDLSNVNCMAHHLQRHFAIVWPEHRQGRATNPHSVRNKAIVRQQETELPHVDTRFLLNTVLQTMQQWPPGTPLHLELTPTMGFEDCVTGQCIHHRHHKETLLMQLRPHPLWETWTRLTNYVSFARSLCSTHLTRHWYATGEPIACNGLNGNPSLHMIEPTMKMKYIHTYIYTSRNTFIFTYIHTYVHAYTSTKVKPSISIVVVIHLHELHATGCKPLSNKCLLPALNQYPQDTVARRW